MSARVSSAPRPARSRPRRNSRSSPASQRPASSRSSPRGPDRFRKRPIDCAPPIGTTAIPSAWRFRPWRAASASSASRSLIPSTSTTARRSAAGTRGSVCSSSTSRIFTARMHVDVNGTRLWFDVDGPALVPDGAEMSQRPTVVLLHGGPGSFDHSYFKPDFARLSAAAQVVYVDLPGHGRSEWGDPAGWSFELCADSVRDFCDTLGIANPVVYGHSLGGFVAMVYAARHPGHARALVLQSTFARFDLSRIVEGFRRAGGDDVAATAERAYG